MKTETPQSAVTKDNSTLLVASGLGLGAYATGTAVVTGAICPICLFAAPAFAAAGVYQKVRNQRGDEPAAEVSTGSDCQSATK